MTQSHRVRKELWSSAGLLVRCSAFLHSWAPTQGSAVGEWAEGGEQGLRRCLSPQLSLSQERLKVNRLGPRGEVKCDQEGRL